MPIGTAIRRDDLAHLTTGERLYVTLIVGGANGAMRGKGNRHVQVNRTPSVNLLISIAEMADVPVEKIGNSDGKIAL